MPCSQTVMTFLKRIDKDSSGTIDARELLEALGDSRIKEEQVQRFIEQYDKNKDGKLDLSELMDFFESIGL
ncbi:Calcium-binding protein 2 [Echinococcus granulosus]|uniref:Calcium-binding protein n=2 Tax=Echinococcus TaxID=6209 RepID=U6J5U2_ECHGR|nr:Calcium-binding protein [Echinococcus granulosus]EUB63935.1 Calcium-binding protein [Echinococcus granulosus]KAH9281179.1 Calcium-binding protein 2 [Echinococcus granulosus]CDS19438.1 Calcium binding protein [Echinococcus granulosus]CDS37494.1 Calcium binding protein [Echinococcus multilocularis]